MTVVAFCPMCGSNRVRPATGMRLRPGEHICFGCRGMFVAIVTQDPSRPLGVGRA